MITMGVEEYTKDAWGGLDEERHAAGVNPGPAGGIP